MTTPSFPPSPGKAIRIRNILSISCAMALHAQAQSPPPDTFNPGANGIVYSLAVQADGRILTGGAFTKLGEQTRNRLARLDPDGTLDGGFNPGVSNTVNSLVVQTDGRILVGGSFSMLGGQVRTNIARLEADGSLDLDFDPEANGTVNCLVGQADGTILVAGQFTMLGGQPHTNLARLNADGTVDSGFKPGASAVVNSLAVQADGKILVGGLFTTLAGQARSHIGQLNADGTLDAGFNPGVSGTVYSLAVQADGMILVGGNFTAVGGQPSTNLARLYANGTVDGEFNPAPDGLVLTLGVQADGKILAGGRFSNVAGQPRSAVARLNPEGTVDTTFTVGASNFVYSLMLQEDGKVLMGGNFTTVGGQVRTNIARLSNTDLANEDLTFDGSIITWLRGGTSPEFWRTSFEVSTNGADWTSLGAGMRLPGGWQVTGLAFPTNATIRARGFVTGGYQNGSGWFVQSIIGVPFFVDQPLSRTNNFGTTATLSAAVIGPQPWSYQWLKDGQMLVDGANIAGGVTTNLTVSKVSGADAAAYAVVVTNPSGSVTSSLATLTVIDPLITAQPVSQNKQVGQSATLSVTAVGTAPLSFQWLKDGLTLAQRTNVTLALTNLQGSDAGSYTMLVSDLYGGTTSAAALLTVNLATLDPGFNPTASGSVYALAAQADGKILVGGTFTNLAGHARTNLARLNADGTLDLGFNPGANGNFVYSMVVQADGKILVGGDFFTLSGQPRNYLGRLNADGTLDSTFTLGSNSVILTNAISVYSMAVQTDGKILIGGSAFVGGSTRVSIGRLNADGTPDPDFNPGASPAPVYCLAVQGDGKILAGSTFYTSDGQPRYALARLNSDGTLDAAFDHGPLGEVHAVALQADGKVVVGADNNFQFPGNLARLNTDGTLDPAFNPPALGLVSLWSLALQADGRILLGGAFTNLAGQARANIARLHADGTLDPTFNPGADNQVLSLGIQADGKILAGGGFGVLGGQARRYFGRLNNTEPATQSLTYDGSTITWLRGGTSPEVWRTSFDASTNGSDWNSLGFGARIPGGWQVTVLDFPTNATIRARGFAVGGWDSGSGWLLETVIGAPGFDTQAVSRTNNFGSTAVFSAVAGGTGPLSYQWRKDGIALADGGKISGALTTALTLSTVSGADAGDYTLVVTNSEGSATSLVATLTVIDPLIITPPVSQSREGGANVTLSVTATGTAPLNYQWWKDGVALAQKTSASMTLTNLQRGDAGGYTAVIGNPYGNSTSALAILVVNLATVDSGFNPAVGGVNAIAGQVDGKILLGGSFTMAGGQPRSNLARVNADGSLDAGFHPSLARTDGLAPNVYSLTVQADGKIVVAGGFTMLGGQPRTNLARVNADGGLDAGFDPTASPGYVDTVAVQADGKLLVGGSFTMLGGQMRTNIGRLNTNGTVDSGFQPSVSGFVRSLAVQADGKILVGGQFISLGGQLRRGIARLNAEGTLDTVFVPETDGSVLSLVVQADGKILVAGAFTMMAGQPRPNIARLEADGTLDPTFNPAPGGNGTSSDLIESLALQADGKVLLGGSFTTIGGLPRTNIARLNADGSADREFNPTANGSVNSLAIQPDGKILAGGGFSDLGGPPFGGLARLNHTEPATQSLVFNASTVSWLRGGTSPEVWRTTFDYSTDGFTWVGLGPGSRISELPAGNGGGWQLAGVPVPPGATIRVRGFLTGGQFNASGWFVETLLPTIGMLTGDGNFGVISNQFGFNIQGVGSQLVLVEGSSNLVNWAPLYTNTMTNGRLYYSEPASAQTPLRFYRARLWP